MATRNILKAPALVFLALLTVLAASRPALAAERFTLQTPGKLYRFQDFNWSRFGADQRSFRFEGVQGGVSSATVCRTGKSTRYSAWGARAWVPASELRVNLPTSQRTVTRRGYGRRSAYGYNERIISYRDYRSSSRGSTIGRR